METLERAVSSDLQTKTPLINGVRICRLVMVAACASLIIAAVVAGRPFYLLLAALCVAAIAVKTDNVRRGLGAVAAVEGMYFASIALSSQRGGFTNLIVVSGAGLVFIAITRLRFWESQPQELSARVRVAAVVIGIVLFVGSLMIATMPVSSSQSSTATTNVACGNALVSLNRSQPWGNVDVPAIDSDCVDARRDRVAFSFFQLQLAVGLLIAGRTVVRREWLRVGLVATTLVIIGVSASWGWSLAVDKNANKHNELFGPWMATYAVQFSQQSLTNDELRDAVRSNDVLGVASACQELLAIDEKLAPSVDAWPVAATRDNWAAFVESHRAESQACFDKASAMQAGATVNISGWFTNSSRALGKVQSQLRYW